MPWGFLSLCRLQINEWCHQLSPNLSRFESLPQIAKYKKSPKFMSRQVLGINFNLTFFPQPYQQQDDLFWSCVIAVLLIVLHLWNIYEYLNCSQYFEIEHNVFDRTLHNSCSYNWTQYFWDTYWGMTWISTFGGLVDITAYSIIIVLDQNVVSSQSFAAVQRVYS